MDVYFSADVETDGPILGPYSILSFALVYAGTFDGNQFTRPTDYSGVFYRELRPISDLYQEEALRINGLDRERLVRDGEPPEMAMMEAAKWIANQSSRGEPVLAAYPLSFDWTWLYWYFVRFSTNGSPFGYSRCFDIKTAASVKTRTPISSSGRSSLAASLRPTHRHTHHAIDDAIAQAQILANVFEWESNDGDDSLGRKANFI